MDISQETPEQTEERLLKVIRLSRCERYDGEWIFDEFAVDQFPAAIHPEAKAVIRDGAIWSQLVPAADNDTNERFAIFSFHFPAGQDNSGFVGWLATHLKRTLGTGIFVICGQNSAAGGIYDYWGVPASLGETVSSEFTSMMGERSDHAKNSTDPL
jgi:hypothetical protein